MGQAVTESGIVFSYFCLIICIFFLQSYIKYYLHGLYIKKPIFFIITLKLVERKVCLEEEILNRVAAVEKWAILRRNFSL